MARLDDAHQDGLAVISPSETNFAFKHHEEEWGPFPFRNQNSSARHVDDFTRLNAAELRVVQSCKEGGGTNLLESGRIHNYKRPRYSCTSFTAIAPSPTPEVTPLADRWRTSPATKMPGTLVSR